jgi:glutathione S-transferase
MLLYNSQVSGNCYKVRLLFAHLGLDYDRHELSVIDRSNRSEVLGELNPGLRVPTLVLDDGRSLGESDAIIFYFAEGTEYLPEDPFERAQVLQWLFFEQYEHEPGVAVARFLLHYTDDPALHADRIAERQRAGVRALTAMDEHLAGRDYLVADALTIADISLYAYTHVADEAGIELADYPAIGRWLARVAAEPGHIPIDA